MYFILFQIFTSTDYKIEIVKQFRKPVVLTPYIIVQWNKLSFIWKQKITIL